MDLKSVLPVATQSPEEMNGILNDYVKTSHPSLQ